MGVDAEISRRSTRDGRCPFDSAYKFMATFHVAAPVGRKSDCSPWSRERRTSLLDSCAKAYLGDEIVDVDRIP